MIVKPSSSLATLLVLNAGSSSLKFSLYSAGVHHGHPLKSLGHGSVVVECKTERLVFECTPDGTRLQEEWPCSASPDQALTLAKLMGWIAHKIDGEIVAAGHRVVHGGKRTAVVATVDQALLDEMTALVPMAPLHQPLCLAPIVYLAKKHPGLAQFACFDTAFHHTLDPIEVSFGLPRELTEQGLHRYGFHGLSYEYIASVLPDCDLRAAQGRTIVAHLGNGASLCAMNNRISCATTMGFSTLDGLIMGTRPGRLDPGILLYLMRERGMGAQELEQLLYHRCGLLGVSGGIASDMRELSASSLPEAREAIALFVRSVVREIGALTAVLGGLDALVFTGGIGEHATEVRNAILEGCSWLGLERDDEVQHTRGNCLSRSSSRVSAWTIATDENAIIAKHALRLLQRPDQAAAH
jgi:acetate kinase